MRTDRKTTPAAPHAIGSRREPAQEASHEGGLILKLIRELRERGDVSQIVIAHNYLHVLETCDRVCLLQNGHITFNRPTAETSIEELLTLVGAECRDPGT
jgi:simple sugar transport system ATP-binding protein